MHTRLLALAGLSALLLATAHAQRLDNRRLFWTGGAPDAPGGGAWDTTSAHWQTTGSFLAYANTATASPVWSATLPDGSPVEALAATAFLNGDTVVFNLADNATIAVADGADGAGVVASDIVVAGAGSLTLTGGAITADPAHLRDGSVQLTGTATGISAAGTAPAGRLVKYGTGALTLSGTIAPVFTGGIHLIQGDLVIAHKNALGDSDIYLAVGMAAGSINNTTLSTKLPVVVIAPDGTLLVSGTAAVGPAGPIYSPLTLRVTADADGINITGDIHLSSTLRLASNDAMWMPGRIITFDIQGATTISGRILGASNQYGASNGAFVKTGTGTLTLSGTANWFYGTSTITAGKLVATDANALGSGDTSIINDAILEFRGVTSGTMSGAFIGGGRVDVTGGSDLTFNWHNGELSSATRTNLLSALNITGGSRLTALASGTLDGVLGAGIVEVTVSGASTLVLGREGISSRGTGATGLPVTYPIVAASVSFTGTSTLVLNPNAYLKTGRLAFDDTSLISFGASGVSRLDYATGPAPDQLAYDLPEGFTLVPNNLHGAGVNAIEYVVINQGANPLKDIAMTLNALDTVHDALGARIAEDFTDPVVPQRPARGRHWVNSAWGRYLESRIDYETGDDTTQPGHSGRVNGFAFGLDAAHSGRVLIGLHAGVVENRLDTTNRTSLASKQKFLGLQGALRLDRFSLAAAAATGRVRTDSLRYETASLVRGKWDTSYFTASLEASYRLSPWKALQINPFAGLRHTRLDISGHYERGPSPLIIDDFSDSHAQSILGLRAGKPFKLFGRSLVAGLTLARKHTIRTPKAALDTHYLDSPATPVTLTRGDYYEDLWNAGLSLRAALTPHTLLGLSYDYDTGADRTRHTAAFSIGCTW
jgi:autotransporter-associated beta strand protein